MCLNSMFLEAPCLALMSDHVLATSFTSWSFFVSSAWTLLNCTTCFFSASSRSFSSFSSFSALPRRLSLSLPWPSLSKSFSSASRSERNFLIIVFSLCTASSSFRSAFSSLSKRLRSSNTCCLAWSTCSADCALSSCSVFFLRRCNFRFSVCKTLTASFIPPNLTLCDANSSAAAPCLNTFCSTGTKPSGPPPEPPSPEAALSAPPRTTLLRKTVERKKKTPNSNAQHNTTGSPGFVTRFQHVGDTRLESN
mmetsp:Transcript_82431/g.207909  ORF Transcript_82431/g.207909 Transcript_82431/m.207909 type:complete len:251 (+) Transcript_82431:171-923(+)